MNLNINRGKVRGLAGDTGVRSRFSKTLDYSLLPTPYSPLKGVFPPSSVVTGLSGGAQSGGEEGVSLDLSVMT